MSLLSRVGFAVSREFAPTDTQQALFARLRTGEQDMNMTTRCTTLARIVLSLSMLLALLQLATAQNVTTWHNDISRSGQYLKETTLSLTNVNSSQFGKKSTLSLDGEPFAQPLYMGSVAVKNQGTHNVVFVATENDSVYAFDAGGSPTTPLWHTSFLTNGAVAVPCGDTGSCEITPVIGITGTPVIDGTTNTLYVVAMTKESGSYVQRLHALDITSGSEKFGGPVTITASVSGTGTGSSGGTITFDPKIHNQRSALLLSKGIVYIAWASFGDLDLYHGWIMGYSASALVQKSVLNVTPNGSQGGIWMSSGGPSADTSGNIFAQTGNGTFDANMSGGVDYGDSFLKLTSGLAVTDYFSPHNEQMLDDDDDDLGSTAGLMLPHQSGSFPNEITGAGKQGIIYLVNRDSMGKFNSSTNKCLQTITAATGGYYGTPAYFNGAVYYAGAGDNVRRYTLTTGKLSTTAASKSSKTLSAGGTPSISANGTVNGIVWVIDASPKKATTAVLHAIQSGQSRN